MNQREGKRSWTAGPVALAVFALATAGCAREAVAPGERGLRYDPHGGGVKPEVLQPGLHGLGWCFLRDCGYIDTYDITYQTRKETVFTPSAEGLSMDVKLTVMFRPVISELYQLHTEIGKDFYEEIVGPEFRSAARNVLARHSYTNLVGQLDKVEDEIEEEVRRRTRNKHIEVATITLEQIKYASPEIAQAVEKRLVGQQEAARQKAAIEAGAAREKMQLELTSAQERLKAESEANQKRLQAELAAETQRREADFALLRAKTQKEVLQQQLAIDKLEAEQKVVRAKAAADERRLGADALAAENRAQAAAHTPLTVQAASYEALGKLGGNGTTVFLGDWSRAPQFLWPQRYGGMGTPPSPLAPAANRPAVHAPEASAPLLPAARPGAPLF